MNHVFSRNLSLILLSICIAAARPANLLAENVLIFSSGSKVIDNQLQDILQAYGHSATIPHHLPISLATVLRVRKS